MGIAVAIEAVPTGAPLNYEIADNDGKVVDTGKGVFLSELGEGLAKILTKNDMIRVVPISALLIEKLT